MNDNGKSKMKQRDWVGCRNLSKEIVQVLDPRDGNSEALLPNSSKALLDAVQTGALQRIASLLEIVFGFDTEHVTFVDRFKLEEAIGLPCKWLDDEAKAGRIPCLTIGKTRYYRIDEVRYALKNRASTDKAK